MKQFLLWLLAIIITVAAVLYQRATGPTYPVKGSLTANTQEYKYKLIRSHETTAGAKVALPNVDSSKLEAVLHYKRYQTKDEITLLPFALDGEEYTAQLPIQPSAGKMEYFVEGTLDGKAFRIPEMGQNNIVLRYKDPVPSGVLFPHIFFMFFAILFGMRAAISAFFDVGTMRKWALVSFIGMTIGGMMLGPIVQKYAFGEYWTGFPYGGDFTDNKMLIMWLAWAIAMAVIGFKPKKNEKISRLTVLFAAVVMTAVYLIPHSMGGSTLDYEKVDQGINPSEAIKTGAE
ncbi:MAG TPA: hypothetical protein EYG92_02210 [Lutibacter sp.]|nr:hypothetical protein [Lutibacter sp.]